jgi:hypothetical protein
LQPFTSVGNFCSTYYLSPAVPYSTHVLSPFRNSCFLMWLSSEWTWNWSPRKLLLLLLVLLAESGILHTARDFSLGLSNLLNRTLVQPGPSEFEKWTSESTFDRSRCKSPKNFLSQHGNRTRYHRHQSPTLYQLS